MAISSAAAVIDVRVNNLAALKKLEGGTRKVQQLFDQIKQQRNVFDQSVGKQSTRQVTRNLRELIKGFASAKEGSRQFQVALEQTTSKGTVEANKTVKMYSKTLAGLGSQLQAIDKILANSTVGQEEFNDALVVSNKLQRELVRNQLAAAGAEAKAGAGSVQGLLALGKEIPNSVKALELYQDELNDLQRTVDRTSQDFFELGKEIERVDLLLGRGPRQGQGPRGRRRGKGGDGDGGGGGGRGKSGGRFGNILQGAILGGGFPLLFGGPSFSAAGGLLGGGIGGGIGTTGKFGFAGGIAGSVVGGIFDAVVKAALELGKALENPTKNLQALTDQLPISGTATKGLIEQLEAAGLSSVAASLALSKLDEELEKLGLSDEDIKDFKGQTQEFDNALKSLKLAASGLASQGLIDFMTLLTKLANIFRDNTDPIVRLLNAVGGFVIGDDRALGEQLGMGPTTVVPPGPLASPPAGTKVKPDLTKQEVRAQQILANLAEREVKFATDAAAIERNRLGLIRGRLAEANAIVDIDKAEFNLIKAQLNFDTETNDALKEQLRIKKDIAQAELNQAIAAKNNATILRIQADAAFDLERRMVAQAEVMKDLQAGTAAQQAIRATSPFANESFLVDPFTGGSRKLESEQNLRFAETLRVMNAELANVNKNIALGTLLNDDDKRALNDKRIALENSIARYKEYQPAIDEAALAQARFNEALAITTPITNDLVNGLVSVVEGTKTAEQAFADFLRGIASMLIDAAKQMIATYIAIGIARMFAGVPGSSGQAASKAGTIPSLAPGLGGGGALNDPKGLFSTPTLIAGRARGGPVGAGRPYMVGERGPELFVPRASGTVVPNHAMGGATVNVAVDASGSSVEGDADQAGQLGKAIGVAVQQELIKQKRPGGLLAV